MSQQFEITTFRPATVEELAKFLGSEYPSGEISNEKYLSWEYLDNPYGKAIVTTARNSEKEIVAQYALLAEQINFEGKVIPATLSMNTLTSKAYRGKGLFTSTAIETFNYCRDNSVAFTFGVPNKNSFPVFVNKLEFKHAGDFVFMAKPLRPLKVLNAMINRSEEKRGIAIPIAFDKNKLAEKSISDLIFPEDEKVYQKFLELWQEQGNISIHRSPVYMQWRYMQNPSKNYELLKLVTEGEIKSVIVIRAMHLYGMKVCLVMDIMSLKEKYSNTLLKVISAEAKSNLLDLMIAIAAHKKSSQHFQFVHSAFWNIPRFLLPQRLPFIIRVHNDYKNLSRVNDLKNWHFSFGDYDVF